MKVDIDLLARALHIDNVDALRTGFEDGKEQGFELSSGMSYEDLDHQWAYDVGTYIGACVGVHSDTLPAGSKERLISKED